MDIFSSSIGEALQLAPQLDILCFSHLRWQFVTQRPQHLLRRAAATRRVFYWEEPFLHAAGTMPMQATLMPSEAADAGQDEQPRFMLEIMLEEEVTVLRPHLRDDLTEKERIDAQACLLQRFAQFSAITSYIAWYYTPMATAFTYGLRPVVSVYDCMDELSLFQGAPPALRLREDALLRMADVVFTGGISLYEAKRKRHSNVHAFPSSIDHAHFAAAHTLGHVIAEPQDQVNIPRPRAGFYGVLDERLDIDLLRDTAALLPSIHFVLIGPVVKIDPATLPAAPNLHYLGPKRYEELPLYLAGWDVALLPFSRNNATRFISPTKTPEYLAAGKPVVSTSIRDVVREYGDAGLVRIADTADEMSQAILAALQPQSAAWRASVQHKLAQTSWDQTWAQMETEIAEALAKKQITQNTVSRLSAVPIGPVIAGASASAKSVAE